MMLLLLIGCTPSSAVLVTPNPAYHFPQLKARSAAFMDALFVGYLVARDGCLRVSVDGLEEGYLVIWQPGYFLNDNDGAMEILDADGQVVSRIGEVVGLSGGEQPLRAYLEGHLREPLPEACAGPYWLMGESLFAFGTVPFAELVANPSRYSGRNVCSAGVYANGFEVNALAASTYRDRDAVYLTEPVIWIEGASVLSRGDCFGSTPAVEFCEATMCGVFQHGEHYGHLGGYGYQILPAVLPSLPDPTATLLPSPPAADDPARPLDQSATPGPIPDSKASEYRDRWLCFAVDVPADWRVEGALGGYANLVSGATSAAFNIANVSLDGTPTLELALDEVKRGSLGTYIRGVEDSVVDGQPALGVTFAPGAQFRHAVIVIAPDCGDGPHALFIASSGRDRGSFEAFVSRLRFLQVGWSEH